MLKGIEVSLSDMLNCRERRAHIQQVFIDKYKKPVISFCMNIPGPIKTTPEINAIFKDGLEKIYTILNNKNIRILDSKEFYEPTGDEIILSINCDDAQLLKDLMTCIEETHPLGRLFDIDVINTSSLKISRSSYRKCLLCNCQAQECASSRKHSVSQMQQAIEILIQNYKKLLEDAK